MTVTRDTLVTAFPEFASTATYPQGQIDFWLTQAAAQLDETQYGASYDLAVMLFVAHYVTLSATAARAAQSGGSVGATGVVASKSIDKVSVSYDLNLTAYRGAGPWNATSYGQRFYAMLRAASTGPLYRVPGQGGYAYR